MKRHIITGLNVTISLKRSKISIEKDGICNTDQLTTLQNYETIK